MRVDIIGGRICELIRYDEILTPTTSSGSAEVKFRDELPKLEYIPSPPTVESPNDGSTVVIPFVLLLRSDAITSHR